MMESVVNKTHVERNNSVGWRILRVLSCVIQCLIVVLAGLTMLGLADGIDFTTFNLFSALAAPPGAGGPAPGS
ncbi:MAG: hypothetical protein KF778_05575 [Rhodocyclaceae bacterium]|nr:hypothetical protein [Rhodocyclaceae bacterium]MBX3667853.1 hypothetical protein [Rhodocyclaceae bacterium]